MADKLGRFGLSVALATPFEEDGSVDIGRLTEHAIWCLAHGCQSVTLFGTTGEGPSLSRSEKATIISHLQAAGIPGDRMVLAIIATAASDAVEQINAAYAVDLRNVLVAPPYYYKQTTDDGVFRWYETVINSAGAAARDLILYNIPSLTGAGLSIDLISRLRDAFGATITGVKDSSCDWRFTEPLVRAHGDIDILVGDERDLAGAVRLGGAGSICGVANVFPEAVSGLVSGHDDPFINEIVDLIDGYSVVAAIKLMTAAESGNRGWKMVRPPLDQLSPAGEQTILEKLKALKLNRAA